MDAAEKFRSVLPELDPLSFVVEVTEMKSVNVSPDNPPSTPVVDAAVTVEECPTSVRSTSVKFTVIFVAMALESAVSEIGADTPDSIDGTSFAPVIRIVITCVVTAFAAPLLSLIVTV